MMKYYNPYTVPEGFFEENGHRIMDSYRRRSRTMKYILLCTAAAALLLMVVPAFVRHRAEGWNSADKELAVNNLAGMYDCDVFLQINF